MMLDELIEIKAQLSKYLSRKISDEERRLHSVITYSPYESGGMRQAELVVNQFDPDSVYGLIISKVECFRILRDEYLSLIDECIFTQVQLANAYRSNIDQHQIESTISGMRRVSDFVNFFFHDKIFSAGYPP